MSKYLRKGIFNAGICLTVLIAPQLTGYSEASPINEQPKTITISGSSVAVPLSGKPKQQKKKKKKKKIRYKTKWVKNYTYIRKSPSKKSKIKKHLNFNAKVKCASYNKKWARIKYKKNKIGYISKKDISKKKNKYSCYRVPKYSGYKSWMPYSAITSSGSPQYKLQQRYAYTGNYGIRMVKDRYCVAIGYHFKSRIGQCFDLVLANGSIIKCIKGDEKAVQDTDSQNIFSSNGCASEFLVSRSALASSIKRSGNASSACKKWRSRVVKIKVYRKNILKSGR